MEMLLIGAIVLLVLVGVVVFSVGFQVGQVIDTVGKEKEKERDL